MYCLGGQYSTCSGVESYFMEMPADALITSPTECNPCNPDCFVGTDAPDDTDLTPANSSSVEYDPGAGGLILNACGSPPAPILRYNFDGVDTATDVIDRAPPAPDADLVDGGVTPANISIAFDAYGGHASFFGGRLEATAANSDTFGAQLQAANEYTLETWVATADGAQTGPTRIITYGEGSSSRAFTIGQEADEVVVRMHTSATNVNGTMLTLGGTAELTAAGVFPNVVPVHIVATWDGATGMATLYIDGVIADSVDHGAGADLSTWTMDDTFGLGDEFGAVRTWTGNNYHTTMYMQALDATEVYCRTQAGPDPTDLLDDSDGDGVPDTADDCVGIGWTTPCDGDDTNDGIFHELAFGGPAELSPLDINTTLQTADVYILMDGSGSMDGEIDQLKLDLTSGAFGCAGSGGIIGAIDCTFPAAAFGLGYFVEYPDTVHGDEDSIPYRHLQDITTDIAAVQAAVNNLTTNGNIDTPEAQTQALHAVATGQGMGAWVPNRQACPNAGDYGYPCFRAGTIPIILMFTDATMHNGPSGSYGYTTSSTGIVMPEAFAVLENDDFGSAYALGDLSGSAVTIMGSTFANSNLVTNVGCSSSSNDAVFQFTLSSAANVKISTRLAEYNSVVALYDNSGTPVNLACDDDWSGVLNPVHPYVGSSEFTQSAVGAGTYHVVVDGNGDRGSFQLVVDGSDGTAGSLTPDAPFTYAETIAALTAREIRVITVNSGDAAAGTDADDLGTDTNSVDDLGNPYVETIATNGTGLSTAVSDAVFDLANSTRFDISLVAEDNPATALVDEASFVNTITVTSCPAARCDPGLSGNMCLGCIPATDVGFSVTFQNTTVMPALTPQLFTFDMVLYADGSIELARVPVRIVVPPDNLIIPSTGLYQQTYDATTICDVPTTRPDWGDFSWTNDTGTGVPLDSQITYRFRTANTAAELGSATAVSFTDPTSIPGGAPPLDIGAWLLANGESNFLPFLQVTAVMQASSDALTSPVLYGFNQEFTCTPVE